MRPFVESGFGSERCDGSFHVGIGFDEHVKTCHIEGCLRII